MNQNKTWRSQLFRTNVNSALVKNRFTRWTALIAGIMLVTFMSAPAVMGADNIDPEADKILKSMSTFMDGLSAFSAKADVDNELIDLSGQKIQLSSSGEIIFKRPDGLYMHRQGAIVDIKLFFDGKMLTLQGMNLNVYFQKEAPGTTDAAIETLHNELGLDTPGADLLFTDAYKGLIDGVVSSAYLGTAYVNGVECHYMTFRKAQTDWQLWVRAEGDPLPMKYVITTKWMAGAPQYSVRFREWNTAPKIEVGQFDFKAPEEAVKLEEIQVNEMGEMLVEEGGK